MPIDAFVRLNQRLTQEIDMFDTSFFGIGGKRSKQIQEIRDEAIAELGARLNADFHSPVSKNWKMNEKTFFTKLKEMAGDQHPPTTLEQVRSNVNRWKEAVLNRSSDWEEFFSKCKNENNVRQGHIDQIIPQSKDLSELAETISKEALEVLALSSNYLANRDKIAADVFTEIEKYQPIIEEIANYDDPTKARETWKKKAAEKAQAEREANKLKSRMKALASSVIGGAVQLAKKPSEIGAVMQNHPLPTLAASAAAIAGLGYAAYSPTLRVLLFLGIIGTAVFLNRPPQNQSAS
jgi:hypothetical protein